MLDQIEEHIKTGHDFAIETTLAGRSYVRLLKDLKKNEERPAIWEQVSDWIDRNGSISNRELRRITGIETLKASKMLKKWVDADMLVPDTSKGKRGTRYMRVGGGYVQQYLSLSELTDNKQTDDE